MDKSKILRDYVGKMYMIMDELRQVYPKSRATEVLEMEKGYKYCVQKSATYIEELLDVVESCNNTVSSQSSPPLHAAIDKSIEHTNSISSLTPSDPKKKKPFLQVVSEGFTDMGKDFYKAAQSEIPKDKK